MSNIVNSESTSNGKLPRQKKVNNAEIIIVDGVEMLKCNTCGCTKVVNDENFIRRSDNKLGWRRQCRACVKHRRSINEYTEEAIFKKSNHSLKAQFGITRDEFDTMYEDQNGECKICRKKCLPRGLKKDYNHKSETMHVDHCHATGAVRGLLCGTCNTGIGMFNEDIETLNSAIEYIKGFKKC